MQYLKVVFVLSVYNTFFVLWRLHVVTFYPLYPCIFLDLGGDKNELQCCFPGLQNLARHLATVVEMHQENNEYLHYIIFRICCKNFSQFNVSGENFNSVSWTVLLETFLFLFIRNGLWNGQYFFLMKNENEKWETDLLSCSTICFMICICEWSS